MSYMVYRLQLIYDEIIDILDVKNIAGSTIRFTLPPGVYEISDISLMLKSLLPGRAGVKVTIDDIRLKSNLNNDKPIRFTEKIFFNTFLGSTESHSGVLGDTPGCVQLIPGKYESEKPINITGIDKSHLKCDCFNASNVNGVREPILYSFVLSLHPAQKIFEEPRIKPSQR